MSNYVSIIGNSSPTMKTGKQVVDLVAALVPPAGSPAPGAIVKKSPGVLATLKDKAVGLVPTAVGAGVGYWYWKKHPVLGLVAGGAVGASAYELYKGDRKKALADLAWEAAGVVGALKYKKHPVLGWVGGMVVGGIATSFVDGSSAQSLKAKLGY